VNGQSQLFFGTSQIAPLDIAELGLYYTEPSPTSCGPLLDYPLVLPEAPDYSLYTPK